MKLSRLKKLTLSSASLTILLLAAPTAHAAIDEAGAQELKTLINQYIEDQKQLTSVSGATLLTEGELQITPQGSYYQVITPYLKTVYPGDVVYDLGKVSINAMPGATAEEWKMSIALPSPISLYAKDGSPIWKLDLHDQNAAIIWNTGLKYTTHVRAGYKNVEMTFPASKTKNSLTKMTINNVNILQDFTQDQTTQKWSGPINFKMTGISGTAGTEQLASVDELSLDYDLKNFDAGAMTKMQDELKSLSHDGSNIATSPEKAARFFDIISSSMTSGMGSITSALAFKNINLKSSTGDTPFSTSIDNGKFVMSMDTPQGKETNLGLMIDVNGVKAHSDKYQKLIPQKINLDIKITDFPLTKLIKMGQQQMAIGMGKPESSSPSIPPQSFPELLAAAGTRIDQNLAYLSDALKINGNGYAKAEGATALGGTAEQNLEIEGLDILLADISEMAKTDPSVGQVLGGLTMFQMMGQQDPNNPNKRTYKLIVDKDGRMTMNGSDLSGMMGAAQ